MRERIVAGLEGINRKGSRQEVNKIDFGKLLVLIDAFRNRMYAILCVFFLILSTSGCVNYLENADSSFLREDWGAAVYGYRKALRKAEDPAEITHIKRNLSISLEKATILHLGKANNLKHLGDIEQAYAHAKKAFSFIDNSDTRTLLKELEVLEAERLIQVAERFLHLQEWDNGIASLENSLKISPNDKANELLAAARNMKAQAFREKFNDLKVQAEDSLHAREWSVAEGLYNSAHKYGETIESKNQEEFVGIMIQAESADSKSESNAHFSLLAEKRYREALPFGFHQEYIKERIEAVSVRSYKVTIHSAVIAPEKPSKGTPWDGIAIPGIRTSEVFSQLGASVFTGGGLISTLGPMVMGAANDGISAPDCALEIIVSGKVYGGIQTVVRDTHQPQWDYSLTFNNVPPGDKRVLNIRVTDIDDTNHDPVGSYQVVLGDLVKQGSVQEIPLFSNKGELLAGGLLALKISVETIQ